jgi:glucose 1-dehydrogenase
MKSLAGKNAIVTGASRGIGAAVAIALAEAGANVAINYYSADEEAEAVAQQCRAMGVEAYLCKADVGNRDEVEKMVADVVASFGSIDVAVSNAAYSDRELFYEADIAGFERTVQVTMWGAYYLLRSVTQQMVAAKIEGSIVIVSSPHSWRPFPGAMAYNMSKAAIDQMARTAATELCEKRIRVNIVHPGWTDTPGERKFFSEEALNEKGSALPLGRLGNAQEIARGVVFMCEPGSEYITGSSLLIDGGSGLPVQHMQRFATPPKSNDSDN